MTPLPFRQPVILTTPFLALRTWKAAPSLRFEADDEVVLQGTGGDPMIIDFQRIDYDIFEVHGESPDRVRLFIPTRSEIIRAFSIGYISIQTRFSSQILVRIL